MSFTLEQTRQRLFNDTQFWAENCAKIVDHRAMLVPLVPNLAQRRLDAALEGQRGEGRPMRAIALKARKVGISTWTQAKIMHRVTQRQHRRGLVVAQDKDTAGELFGIGERIWQNLPADDALRLKPPLMGNRRGTSMHFGERSRDLRERGEVGLDSRIDVDTANEVEAGRGYTYTELHLSEVAFWPDVRKMTALLNAVPDEPETLIVVESTANATNHFKTMWDRAVAGESQYAPVFVAWWEDPRYTLPFRSEEERAEFESKVGTGPWGEDESRLMEEFGCTLEQLNWRQRAISDKCDSKLETWDQEYPASPEVAFQASGKHVFSMYLVKRVLDGCRVTDPAFPDEENPGPDVGSFVPDRTVSRKTPSGLVDVPTGGRWKPAPRPRRRVAEGQWRIWEHPDKNAVPKQHYVVSVDPAEGADTTSGESAFMAVQVIDHRTKRQVAEYQTRDDWDLVLMQAVLAAHYFNRAAVSVEKTGGYGTSMIQRLRDMGYWPLYRQKVRDHARNVSPQDRTGFNTDRATKPLLEDGIKYLLREMPEAFRSFMLAYQLTTYIKDGKTGKTGPEPDAFSDLLMAFAMAEQVALEMPVPSDRGATSSTVKRAHVNPVTKL